MQIHLAPPLLKLTIITLLCTLFLACKTLQKQGTNASKPFEIIAYYDGNGSDLDQYRFDQLTQVIFSFCHLRGNLLTIDNAEDSLTIRKLVALKQKHTQLKVLLSLGGWCGCKTCANVFTTEAGRHDFAVSTLRLLKDFGADGLDLDWEYPGIEGCPGHDWSASGREHFTLLIKELRAVLGKKYELSFAAGGFKSFFDESVEWQKVMPLLDRINLMSYDLTNGFSTVTGHHTPLYSNSKQQNSVDYAIRYLDSLQVPRAKIIVGAAFYARTWEQVARTDNGLYQNGKFQNFIPFNQFPKRLSTQNGFVFHRDEQSKAPFAYNPELRQFATFDDPISVAEKTKYAKNAQLGGIMFWVLGCDMPKNGLLEAIYKASGK
jgi:chitinase